MLKTKAGWAALLVAAIAACSPRTADAGSQASAPAAAPAAAVHPVSGLPVIPLEVTAANGPHAFRVEVARSPAEWSKGLMFRTQLGTDEGMIFVGRRPEVASFWMRNTLIPLDIVFIGTDHRILNISANAVPYDETPRSSAGIADAILELPGGRTAQLGIKAGDKVDW